MPEHIWIAGERGEGEGREREWKGEREEGREEGRWERGKVE